MNANGTHTSTTAHRYAGKQRIAMRVLTIGMSVGILSLIVLFVVGVVAGSAPMMVAASASAAVVGAAWVAAYVGIRAKTRALA